MEFDLVQVLGVSREALVVGALVGLGLAVLLAVMRRRRDGRPASAGLGLDRDR